MAMFGSTGSFIGIDIGTASLKLVELTNRRKRLEVTAYAQADYPNPLTAQTIDDQAVKQTASVITEMMEKAGITGDTAVAALPASAVFSTVVTLPAMNETEMEKAVEFAAREVVPAALEEVVLGYSRLGEQPHMKSDAIAPVVGKILSPAPTKQEPIPVFITAAPKYLVNRYTALMQQLKLKLQALELETFPLVRSLLPSAKPTAMIVDIGDRATTFHIIDAGTPRVSHTMEFGGHDITAAIAEALTTDAATAEQTKYTAGLTKNNEGGKAASTAVMQQLTEAKNVLTRYQQQQQGSAINQTVLIGGGANLPGLAEFWSQNIGHKTTIGNPWRGLAYPNVLDNRLRYLGPTYGVAVGLALRELQRS